MEFALVAVPFLALVLFVFEFSFDLFTQALLDSALHQAARQIQTGNAQNAASGSSFITNTLCPYVSGVLSCNNLYVKVQKITASASQDYYDFTTGAAPVSGGVLDLSGFSSGSFCNAGPSQFLLVSAIYVGPTLVGTLFPGVLTVRYGGAQVHPTLSTVGFVSEAYTAAAASGAAGC